ncbi:FHA domain-containing protein [bacterium]|nr:FHA domain-containing protein [bacterium]
MGTLLWETRDGNREFRLGPKMQIGRSPLMDVCVPDPGVSGFHASIVCDGDAWCIEDAGSTNGTFVNGERVQRGELRDGDEVRLGNVTLTFQVEMEADASTMLWQKGLGEEPVPREADTALHAAASQAGALRDLLCEESQYKPVTSLDSERYTSTSDFSGDENPTQIARRLRVSYEISQATAATLDPSEILDRVLTALFGIFDQAERSFIVLVDPDTHEMHTAAVRERGAGMASKEAISRTALEQAMRDRQALLCRDAAADERFAKAQSIMSLGIRSMMIAPLLFRDEVLGAVHVDSISSVREFTEADLELLSIAASQVAGCLANARLHEKVVESERLAAVGQTVAGLSHCVKNILQGIKGGGYILAKGLEQNDLERVRGGWEMVERNNGFMEELVFDLLSYSRKREPDYTPADLNEVCEDVCLMAKESAREKGVALQFEPDPSLGIVEFDATGIRRCVLNLITNAVDACEEQDGTVIVRVHADGADGVRIAVQDTGCGMSREQVDNLFTVFYSTKGSKGTGLGLPVTKKIVEEHGGQITVESEEGHGTTFTIALPTRRIEQLQEGVDDGVAAEKDTDRG